jgi:iron complex transport system substrate-binding protein
MSNGLRIKGAGMSNYSTLLLHPEAGFFYFSYGMDLHNFIPMSCEFTHLGGQEAMDTGYRFRLPELYKLASFSAILFIILVSIGIFTGCAGDDTQLESQDEPGLTSSTITLSPLPQTDVSESVSGDSLFPFSVTSSNHNEIIFESPPERIVAFDSAVVEIIFAIGEGHRIIGTHDFVEYPSETVHVARVGTAFDMNIEATVALEPDLVVLFSSSDVHSLERAGMRVLYLESLGFDFRKVSDNIRLWGRVVGNPQSANSVAQEFDARVEVIEKTLSNLTIGQRVFQDEGDLWTAGPDTLVGEVMTLLKLQNIAHDISGYAQLSPEVIVQRDPEIIIASYRDTISNRPAFKEVTAIKEERVFVSEDLLSIAGPRFIDGVEELAEWVYPDLFK